MTDPSNSEPQITNAKIDTAALPCDIKVFKAANSFAEALIQDVPELQAVAFIPLWAPSLENVPSGLIRLRNETPPYLAGLLQMLGQLTAFGVDVHKDMIAQLTAFDKMASDLVMEIHAKTAELTDLAQKIQQAKTTTAAEEGK
jgi:hypothetical protein